MKAMHYVLASALVLSANPAEAQTVATPIPSTSQPILAGVTDTSVLRAGTPVALKTSEDLTTKGKKLKAGQRIQLETAEDVTINGVTVIPIGSPVTGELTDVRNKGMWGKSGRLQARVLFVRANGRQIRMTGSFDDKGTAGGIGATAVSALVFLPAGFFMTGTSAHMAKGLPVSGFIDEDVPVAFGAGGPAPMVIAPVAATLPAPASNMKMMQAAAPQPLKR